ncbi:MAG: YgiT-type zinc finger protein [Chloroflexota bacterium]
MLRTTLDDEYVCPNCHLGHMHLRLTVYVRLFGETLISVPNTPAWECDVCHQREFDPDSVQRIELLVGQAGPPPNRHRVPERRINRVLENATPKVYSSQNSKPPSKAKS